MELTEEHKNEVGKQLVLTMAQAADEEKITMDDIRAMSDAILQNLDPCKTQEDVIKFLTELYLKWPIFSHIVTVEKGKVLEEKEKEKIQELEELIKKRKLDEALQTAKTVIESSKAGGNLHGS